MAYPQMPTTEYKGPKAAQPEWIAYNSAKAAASKAAEDERHANRKFDTVSADVVYGGGGGPKITRKSGIRVPLGTDTSQMQGLTSYGPNQGQRPRTFSNEHGSLTKSKVIKDTKSPMTATNTWSGPNPFQYTSTITPIERNAANRYGRDGAKGQNVMSGNLEQLLAAITGKL